MCFHPHCKTFEQQEEQSMVQSQRSQTSLSQQALAENPSSCVAIQTCICVECLSPDHVHIARLTACRTWSPGKCLESARIVLLVNHVYSIWSAFAFPVSWPEDTPKPSIVGADVSSTAHSRWEHELYPIRFPDAWPLNQLQFTLSLAYCACSRTGCDQHFNSGIVGHEHVCGMGIVTLTCCHSPTCQYAQTKKQSCNCNSSVVHGCSQLLDQLCVRCLYT